MFLDKFLGKVRKFERHSSFGVGVITILPEGGFEKPPSLNRVNVELVLLLVLPMYERKGSGRVSA